MSNLMRNQEWGSENVGKNTTLLLEDPTDTLSTSPSLSCVLSVSEHWLSQSLAVSFIKQIWRFMPRKNKMRIYLVTMTVTDNSWYNNSFRLSHRQAMSVYNLDWSSPLWSRECSEGLRCGRSEVWSSSSPMANLRRISSRSLRRWKEIMAHIIN